MPKEVDTEEEIDLLIYRYRLFHVYIADNDKQFTTVYTIIGLNTIQNGNRHSTKHKTKGLFYKIRIN